MPLIRFLLPVLFALFFSTEGFAAAVSCSTSSDCDVYVSYSTANWADCGTQEGNDDNTAYCTLSAAEAAYEADISGWTNNADMVFHVSGSDNAILASGWSGWTTDTESRIIIQVDATDRNTTTIFSTSYPYIEISVSGANERAISIAENFAEVYGFQLKITNNGNDNCEGIRASSVSGASEIVVAYNRVWGVITGAVDCEGINIDDSEITAIVHNNIVYDFDTSGSDCIFLDEHAAGFVYSNVVYNCDRGILETDGSPIKAYNNITYGNTNNWWGNESATTGFSGSNNASTAGGDANGDCPDDLGGTCITIAEDGSDLTNVAAYDFSITDTDSQLYNVGKDLDADLGVGWQDDILGVDRDDNTPWDIGAFEFVAGAPPARNRLMFIQ